MGFCATNTMVEVWDGRRFTVRERSKRDVFFCASLGDSFMLFPNFWWLQPWLHCTICLSVCDWTRLKTHSYFRSGNFLCDSHASRLTRGSFWPSVYENLIHLTSQSPIQNGLRDNLVPSAKMQCWESASEAEKMRPSGERLHNYENHYFQWVNQP